MISGKLISAAWDVCNFEVLGPGNKVLCRGAVSERDREIPRVRLNF